MFRHVLARARPRRVWLSAAIAAGLFAIGGGALAVGAIPDVNGVFHACYNVHNGNVRLVETGPCRPDETLVSWNQAGQPGPQGPQGVPGTTGATGPAGPAGPQGPTGAQGPQGVPGATGATGPAGPAGPQGTTGATGSTGPAGPAGPQGPTGAPGTGINVLAGGSPFVDALDTDGFVGLGEVPYVRSTAAVAGTKLAAGGTLRSFTAGLGSGVIATGSVTFTVLKNGVVTAASCSIAAAASSCNDAADTVTFAAGDSIAVEIKNATGVFLLNAGWTAGYGA